MRGPFHFFATTASKQQKKSSPSDGISPSFSMIRPPMDSTSSSSAQNPVPSPAYAAAGRLFAQQGAIVQQRPVVFILTEFIANLTDQRAEQVVQRVKAHRIAAFMADNRKVRRTFTEAAE
jgi:hypothetical protein